MTCGSSLQLIFFLDLRSFTSGTAVSTSPKNHIIRQIPVLPGVVALDPHLLTL